MLTEVGDCYRQLSANCGLAGLEAERRGLHVLTFRSATYEHL
uniref:Uncharacterized protein n=1 Tax=Pseudomonas syringae pv. actinidiae TaxID=103796 RepID=A0A286JZX4_PSESF|nr:hypothetical protein [Pseudomonas syringae pv. actinidiae]